LNRNIQYRADSQFTGAPFTQAFQDAGIHVNMDGPEPVHAQYLQRAAVAVCEIGMRLARRLESQTSGYSPDFQATPHQNFCRPYRSVTGRTTDEVYLQPSPRQFAALDPVVAANTTLAAYPISRTA